MSFCSVDGSYGAEFQNQECYAWTSCLQSSVVPTLGKELETQKDLDNEHNWFAVAVMKTGQMVGTWISWGFHGTFLTVGLAISTAICLLLKAPNKHFDLQLRMQYMNIVIPIMQ